MIRFYFDSDVFRHFGTAFGNEGLDPELRRKLVVSPITALEVMSQLVTIDRQNVLAQIQAMKNWLPEPAVLLPMPTYWLAEVGFGKKLRDNMHDRIAESLNACLNTRDAALLIKEAGKLRDFLDKWKQREAVIFTAYQRESLSDIAAGHGRPDRIRIIRALRDGTADRVGVNRKSTLALGARRLFCAHFEYEEERSMLAGTDPNYKPGGRRNVNDAFDSEQLVYLSDPDLRFVTSDQKYRRRVTRCRQANQILTVNPRQVQDAAAATDLLSKFGDRRDVF